jgi:hypothetical protein
VEVDVPMGLNWPNVDVDDVVPVVVWAKGLN